ncbi:MAG TPA: AarF/UbiB family protein, partial [Bacillota bacterium]
MTALSSYRQLRRYRQIAGVLARHGLGALVEHLGLRRRLGPLLPGQGRLPPPGDTAATAVRVRRVLEELGPTFIKIGQIMSTRADLVPPPILAELQKLQDRVPPAPFAAIRSEVERELQAPLESVFATFEPEPLAAASIGQVHAARLHSGEEVAVKVQRPHVRQMIEADLDILLGLAELADRHSPWAQVYPFRDVAREIARTLQRELDYIREGTHAERLRRQAGHAPELYIPRVYWHLTTSRVLTLQRLRGRKLSEALQQGLDEPTRKAIARRLVSGLLEQILVHGFFHADPHPGNIVLLPDGRIGLLDFGIAGRLDQATREQLAAFVIHLMRGRVDKLSAIIQELVNVPIRRADLRALHRDLEELRDRYYQVPFRQIEMSEVVRSFFTVLRQHRLRVPADLTLVGKTLITLEGVAVHLDPELSVVAVAEPLGRRLLRDYTSARALSRHALTRLENYAEPLVELPGLMRDVLLEAREGRPLARIELGERGELERSLSRFVNRLTFSILLLAFSLLFAALVVASALTGRTVLPWG